MKPDELWLKNMLQGATAAANTFTKAHIEKRGGHPWTTEMQLLHTYSELSEVYEALRRGQDIETICEEVVDAILSNLTLLDVALINEYGQDIDLESIKRRLITNTVDKVYQRLLTQSHVGIDSRGSNKTEYKIVKKA